MLTITTIVPPAKPSEPKTYSKRCNAQRAAIATLGPEAREGFEFISAQLDDGAWGWKPTDEVPPMTAAQAKVNGVTYHPPASPPAAFGGRDDDLNIPAELRRENTPEQRTRVAAIVKADRERAVRSPRNARKVANPKTRQQDVPPPKGTKDMAERLSAAIAAYRPDPRPGTKTALVGEMLRRKQGCTSAEVLAATGWPSVSMPAQAKAVGVKLRKEKDGKVSRYWAA
jgi:hypothetical protein